MIYFKVVSRGKGRKLHPASVLKLKAYSLNVNCTDSGGNRAQPYAVSYSPFGASIPVSNRAFDSTYTLPQGVYTHNGSQTFETQGRIPRKGPATGTIHYTASWVQLDIGQVTCDSKTSWTASIDRSGNYPE